MSTQQSQPRAQRFHEPAPASRPDPSSRSSLDRTASAGQTPVTGAAPVSPGAAPAPPIVVVRATDVLHRLHHTPGGTYVVRTAMDETVILDAGAAQLIALEVAKNRPALADMLADGVAPPRSWWARLVGR